MIIMFIMPIMIETCSGSYRYGTLRCAADEVRAVLFSKSTPFGLIVIM